MKSQQTDNLFILEWTENVSLLSSEADAEIAFLEQCFEDLEQLTSQGTVEAVVWIQNVEYSEFQEGWEREIQFELLRDELRWRLVRLNNIRRSIQESSLPWFYLTDKSCLGVLAELMFSCHRRFVFDTNTKFGFPELEINQLPPAGWLAPQILKKPRLLESWKKKNVWKAEEAVQFGLVDAAISWKDWRRDLFSWASRQIDTWKYEGSDARSNLIFPKIKELWPSIPLPERISDTVEGYLQNGGRHFEKSSRVDGFLIDGTAHSICQAKYETWLKRRIQGKGSDSSLSVGDLICIDVTEAAAPFSIVKRLLESGVKIVYFAENALILQNHLERSLAQVESQYRRTSQYQFDKKMSWYVGKRPRQPGFPTLSFGIFRDFCFSHAELEVRGWALSAPDLERQSIEIIEGISESEKILKNYFDSVYVVRAPSLSIPLVFLVKAYFFQELLSLCAKWKISFVEVLNVLRSIGWELLGSEKQWGRFLEYRDSLQTISSLAIPDKIGNLKLDKSMLQAKLWNEPDGQGGGRRKENGAPGPGFLHNWLNDICGRLARALVLEGAIRTEVEADLYLSDALAYPNAWGSAAAYSRRMGTDRITP